MTKTMCDVCGKEMPPQSKYANFRNLNFCISSNGRIWDICKDCRDGFNIWMKERIKERK